MKIIIADDNEECRLQPMSQALVAIVPHAEIIWAKTVDEAIETLTTQTGVVLASLDHDYSDDPFIEGRRVRPTKTGLDVAEALSKLHPQFPVLIHTSNTSAGGTMKEILTSAGWQTTHILHSTGTSEDWLRDVWVTAARDYLI